MFEPPAADLAKLNARLAKLPTPLRLLIQAADNALAAGDLRAAQAALANALQATHVQPDVLCLHGLLLARTGNFSAAVANFEAAIRVAPDDAMAYWQYAQACEEVGNVTLALQVRKRAAMSLPDSPMAWADLGEHLARYQPGEDVVAPLERATGLAPDYAPAQLTLGVALVVCGRASEGAVAIRKAIAAEPAFGDAWLSLVDSRAAISEAEYGHMQELLQSGSLDSHERTAIQFALAQAHESRGRYVEAFELLREANARRKHEIGDWDAQRFMDTVQCAERVFAGAHVAAENPNLGAGIVFIVGMPRSGTTLVEQILASHSQVYAAGERGDLAQVLTEESSRRRQRYPQWVPQATADDWLRLGRRYLELTGQPGNHGKLFVDKMPNNWQAMGAIRSMLPSARIVICRREPLENCWSCFKQYFQRGWEFTYDLEQLALFWKAFDRTASWWSTHESRRVREQSYEMLVEEPAQEIRALLEFCGLQLESACLRPHRLQRHIHTLSATQVRQPISKRDGVAKAYGSVLDPLLIALGGKHTSFERIGTR